MLPFLELEHVTVDSFAHEVVQGVDNCIRIEISLVKYKVLFYLSLKNG